MADDDCDAPLLFLEEPQPPKRLYLWVSQYTRTVSPIGVGDGWVPVERLATEADLEALGFVRKVQP